MISKPWGWSDVQRDVITTWFPEPFCYEDVDRGWKKPQAQFSKSHHASKQSSRSAKFTQACAKEMQQSTCEARVRGVPVS